MTVKNGNAHCINCAFANISICENSNLIEMRYEPSCDKPNCEYCQYSTEKEMKNV